MKTKENYCYKKPTVIIFQPLCSQFDITVILRAPSSGQNYMNPKYSWAHRSLGGIKECFILNVSQILQSSNIRNKSFDDSQNVRLFETGKSEKFQPKIGHSWKWLTSYSGAQNFNLAYFSFWYRKWQRKIQIQIQRLLTVGIKIYLNLICTL